MAPPTDECIGWLCSPSAIEVQPIAVANTYDDMTHAFSNVRLPSPARSSYAVPSYLRRQPPHAT